jgi:hypothetical protein
MSLITAASPASDPAREWRRLDDDPIMRNGASVARAPDRARHLRHLHRFGVLLRLKNLTAREVIWEKEAEYVWYLDRETTAADRRMHNHPMIAGTRRYHGARRAARVSSSSDARHGRARKRSCSSRRTVPSPGA